VTGPSTEPWAAYLFCLVFVVASAWIARNLTRGAIGRTWMAIRDMDIAAEIIGIRPLTAKLSAFAISSFYVGVAGALWAFIYTSSVEALAFQIDVSFRILFMIIIGGLGSILGSFLGAAFIVLLPIFLSNAPALIGIPMHVDLVTHLEFMIFGALIIFFLIVEPHGLARLWQIGKEKLRRWPFPY
jgi:branched-chain amino acid transport system permease protein